MTVVKIQVRRGTAAEWTMVDTILAEGEIGYETDTGLFKIGDGSTAWTVLAYPPVGGVLAGDVAFTPGGALSSTDVQAALLELDSEKAALSHAHSGADITSGTVADARIDAAIARDSEVSAAISALSSVYQPLDSDLTSLAALTTTAFGRGLLELANSAALLAAAGAAASSHVHSGADITSGTVVDARIDAAIARDSEVTAAISALSSVYAALSHAHSGADITSGTVVDARIDAAIARDSEVAAAISALSSIYQAKDTTLDTYAGIDPSANVQSVLSAADYAAIRVLLGLVIGTNVQAYDADLTTYAGISPSANVQSVLGAADYAAIRTLLGLVIGTNVQAYDADLTTYAGIPPSANVQSVLGAADYSAIRTLLGLVIGTNVQAYDADLTTWAGLTPSANAQSLVTAADYAAMRTLLGLVIGTNVQAWDADLDSIAAIATTAYGRSLLAAADAEALRVLAGYAASARTSTVAIANTETVIISYSCDANELAAGTTFRFKAACTQAGTNAATPTIRIRVGGTTLTGNIAATLTGNVGGSAVTSIFEGEVTCRSAGAGGTIIGWLRQVKSAVTPVANAQTGTVAVDTTAAARLIELTFISGNAANTYTFQEASVQKIAS